MSEKRRFAVGLLAVLPSACVVAASAAAPMASEADTSFLGVPLPEGQRAHVVRPDYPTVRMWRYQHTNDVSVHTTCRGVGADSAVAIFSEASPQPGEILVYDVGVRDADLKSYKGLCFWMRGDGGDGVLSIGANWNQSRPPSVAYPRVGRFPLAETTWKKHFVPWDGFTPDMSSNGMWFLNLKLEPAQPRPAWAVLARISLYQNEETEAIEPPTEKDPPGMLPADAFVHPGVAEAGALIPRTLAKLRDRRPVTIVAVGDSITAGAQLWYRNRDKVHRDSDASIYFAVLEGRLAQHYGYASHRAVLKMWQTVDKKTGTTPSGATNDSFAVVTDLGDAAADPALPFNGLQVIGVGAGGQNSRFGFGHLTDAVMYKPDLVVWFYGGNDMPSGNRRDYEAYGGQTLQALHGQSIEVILCRPTFFVTEPYYTRSVEFRAATESLAATHNVPWIDTFGAFHARGRRYVGDLLSDDVHPNEYGHEIVAATLAAAFGVPGQQIWKQPMFRAIAAGSPILDIPER